MNKSNLVVGVFLAAVSSVACSSPDSPSNVSSGVGGNNSAGGTNTTPGQGTAGQGTAGQGTAGQGTAGQGSAGATGNNTAGQGAVGGDTGTAGGATTGQAGGAAGSDTGTAGGGTGSAGGETAGGGTGSTGGTAGGGGSVTCANSDLSTIPIDDTGWVASACNNVGIQGAFYCYDDGVNESGCTDGELPFMAGAGICLAGNTTEDETYAAWGAGVGFGLNESGEGADGAASVKMAYDAAANGVLGFHIVISGDTDGLPIRVAFTRVAEPDGPSPFVEVPGAGEFDVLIADALVPEAWDACTGDDCLANPSGIYDIQIQVVGGESEANYGFCIESITPITDGSAPVGGGGGGAVANYGSAVCGQYDVINNVGPFAIQNNRYNGANHCITAKWDNGSTVGFELTEVSSNIPTGGAPGSYPSVLYGWHVDGAFYGAYQSARQVSAIASATSSMSFTVPGAGRYNVSYDSWLGPSPTAGTTTNDMLEHMIWLNYRDTTPIGSNLNAPITVDGVQWDVWYGPNGGGWNTVSYIRATNTTSATIDIKAFLDDSVSRGYISDSSYLLGVQAGFEIWEANANFSVDSFTLDM